MKIAWLSDSALLSTGFSDATKYILNGLSTQFNHDCWELGHSCITTEPILKPINYNGRMLNFNLLGMGREAYFRDILQQRIKEVKADVFGVYLDTFMVMMPDPWFLNIDFTPSRSFFYYLSDGTGRLPAGCERVLKKVDMPIAASKFAQKQALETHGIKSEYIPNAIDTNIFRPFNEEEKKINKRNWCNQLGWDEDDFIVGNVYRNQGRKFADRMIKIFAKWVKEYKINNAKLLLHADPQDPAATFNSEALIRRLQIENKVRFTGMKYFNGLDFKRMPEIYNLMDVKLDATSGEGFGITIVEAMSCGIPVICTDFTTTPELLVENGKCGEPMRLVGGTPTKESFSDYMLDKGYNMQQIEWLIANGTIVGSWDVDRGICDIDHGAELLNKLYNNPELRKTYGKVGREKVLKYYNWDVVLPQWNTILNKLRYGY